MMEVEMPKKVIVGNDAIKRLGPAISEYNLQSNPLIITEHGAPEDIVNTMIMDNLDFETTIMAVPPTDLKGMDDLTKKIKPKNYSCILGVGGGRIIDVAKVLGHRLGIPFISVPTAAAHDGIGSGRASFKFHDKPMSIEARVPFVIVADTHIIMDAPHRLLAAGCGDIVSKRTSTKDWLFAHNIKGETYYPYAANLAKMAYINLKDNVDAVANHTEDGVKTVIQSHMLSGLAMALVNSSRPASGAEHSFSHALDIIAPGKAMHGEQCGVGTIMMAHLHGLDHTEIMDILTKVGAPTTARGLNVSDDDIIEALTMAHKMRDRFTILGETGLTRDAAEDLAHHTGVI